MTLYNADRYPRAAVVLFFAGILMLGVAVHRDFGIAWDEPAQRAIGNLSIDYVLAGDRALLDHGDRHYGPAFEMALIALERVTGVSDDPAAVTRQRHLVTFLLFFAGLVAFHSIARRSFRSHGLGLLACLLLVLHPRIAGHAFFNSKDVPFLALFIVSTATMIRFLDRRTVGSAVVHALAGALLIDVRVAGVVVPGLTLLFLAVDSGLRRRALGRMAILALIYLTALAALVVLFWPLLWTDPVGRFLDAWRRMSAFPLGAPILYQGAYCSPADVPWHYLPVWIGLTTPLAVLGLAAGGAVATLLGLARRGRRFMIRRRDDLLFLTWALGPAIAVVALDANLYGGWRHLYFIYPGLALLAVVGARAAARGIRRIPRPSARLGLAATAIVLVAANLVTTAVFMVRYHPHGHVYFNRLAGPDLAAVKGRFPLDGPGVSYRKALDFVAANDPAPEIRVHVNNWPGIFNVVLLDPEDRKRLRYAERPEDADYFLTDFRHHPEPYPFPHRPFAVVVDGAEIMAVFRIGKLR